MLAGCVIGLGSAFAVALPAQASTVVGTEFEHENYGGAAHNATHPNNAFICTGPLSDRDVGISNVGTSWGSFWNDRITSFQVFATCLSRHWENAGYTGSNYPYHGDTTNIGPAMNDRTTAIEYS